MDLVEFEDAYSKVTLVSTIRAFSLVARALAAMLETLVRIQYIALLHASCLLECGEGGKHTCLIHMHSTVRICPLQPFTAQTAKLIFISTVSGTYDKCRVFSTRDVILTCRDYCRLVQRLERQFYTLHKGFRLPHRQPCRIVQNSTEQRDICIRNDAGYVTKVGDICLQLSLWRGR